MTVPHATPEAFAPASVPAVRVPLWAWALAVVVLGALYLLLQDNGAVLGSAASLVHEATHDGRHAFGFPCH